MKRRYEGEHVPQIHFLHLKVALEAEPEIWRRLRVTNQLTLRALHQVLQVTMGWSSSDAHEFRVGKRSYREDARARLARVVKPGAVFHYVHDGKRHTVEVEGWSAILPTDSHVLCLEGDGGAFDVETVNALLVALWERPPTSALN